MTTKPVSTRIVVLLITTLLVAFPAKAATTIFGASVFSQTNVTDATSALGFPNGSAALVGVGGELVLQYSSPLTGENIASTFLDTGVVGALNVVALSIGEVIGGVATFSGEFVLVDFGAGGTLGANLESLCAGVSGSGCSLLRFRNAASIGTPGFLLDSVSGVTNAPEPNIWAFMMLGFSGLAWRMKSSERTRKGGFKRRKRPSILKPAQ